MPGSTYWQAWVIPLETDHRLPITGHLITPTFRYLVPAHAGIHRPAQ
jgi:hypothetical protein